MQLVREEMAKKGKIYLQTEIVLASLHIS